MSTATSPKSTHLFKVTYLGVPAEVKELRFGSGPNSLREVRTKWLAKAVGQPVEHEAGTVTSRTIKGNFTKGTGEIITVEHVVSEF